MHSQLVYTDPRAQGKQLIRGSLHAAGYDICIFPKSEGWFLDSVTINPKQTLMVNTGFRIWIGAENEKFFGMVVPRSSVGHRLNIMLGNTTGIIDADYQGEIMLSLHNRGEEPVTVMAGDRMAQMIFLPYETNIVSVREAFSNETERGLGGYGSTGR